MQLVTKTTQATAAEAETEATFQSLQGLLTRLKGTLDEEQATVSTGQAPAAGQQQGAPAATAAATNNGGQQKPKA